MNSFLLDVHRQFTTRICSPGYFRHEWREVCRNICKRETSALSRIFQELPQTNRLVLLMGLPIAVAILVMLAFMTCSPPKDDKFLFFSTLYAFWIGVFGSCQTLNGEVASGEWSYWVLGNRLSFRSHVLAVALVSLLTVFFQVLIFSATVVLLEGLLMKGTLVAVLAQGDFQLFRPDDQGGSGILASTGNWWLAVLLLILALLAASTSGVCVGLLLSAWFKEAVTSVRAAVAIIVIQSVMSATVLERESRFPLLTTWWSGQSSTASDTWIGSRSAFLADLRQRDEFPLPVLGMHKGEALLEDLSLFAPQRYFYNLARILNSNVSGVNRGGKLLEKPFSLNRAFEDNTDVWTRIQHWTTTDADQRLHSTDQQCWLFCRFLLGHLMLPEITTLFVLNLCYVSVAYQKVQKGAHYHVLR